MSGCVRLLRLLQETIARAIELAAFARGQTANAGFRDLVENRIDRSIDVIRFDHASRARLLDDVEFRLGTDSGFHAIPPNELWSSASQLNEQERRAHAGPTHDERSPLVPGQRAARSHTTH